jgi:hypothetical protein
MPETPHCHSVEKTNLDFQTLASASAGGGSWCSTFAYWLGVLSDPQTNFARHADEACGTMSVQYDVEEQAIDEHGLRSYSDIIPALFHPIAPVTLALRWCRFQWPWPVLDSLNTLVAVNTPRPSRCFGPSRIHRSSRRPPTSGIFSFCFATLAREHSIPSAGFYWPVRPAGPIPQPITLPTTQTYNSSWPTSASAILLASPETSNMTNLRRSGGLIDLFCCRLRLLLIIYAQGRPDLRAAPYPAPL